jgi:PRTRC genetic system protein E
MKFFETLVQTGIKDVVFQVKQDDKGLLTVFITPKSIANDSALKELKPIILSGTVEDMDEGFFEAISPALEQAQKLFSNVVDFEAQLAEIAKATADKKKTKAPVKAEKSEDDGEEKDEEETAAKEKVVKVNNEKVFKDFITSIKAKPEPLTNHTEKIEELYALLTDVEKEKAPIKKIRTEFDAAVKKANDIAKAKAQFAPKAETESVSVGEETVIIDIPATPIPEEEIPNVENVGAVEEVVVEEEEVAELVTAMVEDFPIEEVEEVVEETSFTSKEDFLKKNNPVEDIPVVAETLPSMPSAPTPPAPSIPVPAPAPVFEEVDVLVMINQDFSKEDFLAAGWDEDKLVQAGHAKWEKQMVEVAKPKLSYAFPKPFDAEETEA